jgi:hypothetical protein
MVCVSAWVLWENGWREGLRDVNCGVDRCEVLRKVSEWNDGGVG